MLNWSTIKLPPSSVSLMLRDDVLYYAHQQKNNVIVEQCLWPEGFRESSLSKLLSKKVHIQYIIPPEEIEIIHIDTADQPPGSNDMDYVRIELLNYIDESLEDFFIKILKINNKKPNFITTQVVHSLPLKEQIDELLAHGISVNRITLPDGGGIPAWENHEHTNSLILMLDPISPRLLMYEGGKIEAIQTLPKPSTQVQEGICPTLSNSIEQAATRFIQKNANLDLLVLSESEQSTSCWLQHLNSKESFSDISCQPYPTHSIKANRVSDFSRYWVALAAIHYKEKAYLSFDLCWKKSRQLLSRHVFIPSFITLAILTIFTISEVIYDSSKVSSLAHTAQSIQTENQTMAHTLGEQAHTIIGSYTALKGEQNKSILTSLRILASRSFPGLWLNNLTITPTGLTLLGESTSLAIVKQYIHWLKEDNNNFQVTLKNLTTNTNTKDNSKLKKNIARLNKKISQLNESLATATKAKQKTKKTQIKNLIEKRNNLLIGNTTQDNKGVSFTIEIKVVAS